MPQNQGIIRPQSFIQLLPVEILSIIFELVYSESRGISGRAPSSFPYAVAAVCTAWRNVLSHTPKYWHHVVIFINSASTSDLRSYIGIEHQLRWSRDLRICVDIAISPAGVSDSTIEDEHRIVRIVINSLKPYLGRCFTIYYNVKYSSSLPLITADMGDMPNLVYLTLNCSVANGAGGVHSCIPSPSQVDLSTLRLPENITLDGWNFVDLCRKALNWAPRPLYISIRHYKEVNNDGEFWECLAAILPYMPIIELSYIEVNKVSAVLIDEILHACRGWSAPLLEITQCAISDISSCTASSYLALQQIPATEDMSHFLSHWKGTSLMIDDCPTFNDDVLDTLSARKLDPGDDLINRLFISDCPNFTIAGLKKFAEEHAKKPGGLDGGIISLDIQVLGNGPALSEEDKDWFGRNVSEFSPIAWPQHHN